MQEICSSGSVRGGGGNVPTYSAQGVMADRELAGIITDQHGIRQKAVGLDAAPQRPLGGDQRRVGGHPQRRDAEPVEVPLLGGLIGEVPVGMLGQALEDRAGQVAAAHVGQGLGIDHIIVMAGAQQFEPFDKLRSCAGSWRRSCRTTRSGRCRSACRSRSAPDGAPRYRRRSATPRF